MPQVRCPGYGVKLTAIITGAIALTVGLVAAIVTIRAKKLDLVGQSEQRRAEAIDSGYEKLLAAVDSMWHFHCHQELHNIGWDTPFDWEEEWPATRDEINAILIQATDILKANSRHYDSLSTTMLWATQVVWDGYILKMRQSMPQDYAEVRDMIIQCSRIDSRIDEPISKKTWKRIYKRNQPTSPTTGDEKLSNVNAMMQEASARGAKDLVFFHQDQDVMIALIESFAKNPPLFVPSLALTWRRMNSWANKGVLDSEKILCLKRTPPCHEEANERLRDGHVTVRT